MRQYFRNAVYAVEYAPWLTRKLLLRVAVFCALMTVGLLVLDLAVHTGAALTDASGEHLGRDFFNFWSNTLLAASGQPGEAYHLSLDRPVDQSLTYPPIVMLFWWPLARLSFIHALLAWSSLGLALCAWSLSQIIDWERALLASVGAPAAVVNLLIGQNGYFTAALLASGLALLECCPVGAGILLGMLCCKPQLGVLVPVGLGVGGYWRALVVAAATALLLAAGSAILLGPDTWAAFFDRLILQRRLMEIRVAEWCWMPTVFAMMRLAGASVAAAYLTQGASALAAAAAVAALWRRSCSLEIKSASLVIGTFLATPHAWDYDAVILVFAAAWLATEAAKTGFRPWEKISILVLLILPALSFVPARFLHLQIAPILLWLIMAVLLRRGLAGPFREWLWSASFPRRHDGRFPG